MRLPVRSNRAGTSAWARHATPPETIASPKQAAARREFARFTAKERDALQVMGLGARTDRHELRKRYSTLVRRYHPDRNGGDRSHEAVLQRVVEAYQLLRKAAAFR